MRYFFWIFLLFLYTAATAQNEYYIASSGDTVYCEFKKVFPGAIVVKTEGGKKTIAAKDLKGFKKDGIVFVSKKILNQRKNASILLPGDKVDRKYLYSDPNLVMIGGNGITFYELVEFGGASEYGRGTTVSFFIENDLLGLKKVPQAAAMGGAGKEEVIRVLSEYLTLNESIKTRLNINESWKTFNYKGIRKLMEEYTGKKLID